MTGRKTRCRPSRAPNFGKLFIVGVIPGVLMGLALMVMVSLVARREGMTRKAFVGFKVVGKTFLNGFFALMTPAVIMGGIFGGFFTPTEAAAVACLYALFLGFVVYRTLTWEHIGPILAETAETTGLVMVQNLILGTIHPPIGVVLFVVTRIADVSFEAMSRAILPWLIPLVVVLLAITIWPPLTLWLPSLYF